MRIGTLAIGCTALLVLIVRGGASDEPRGDGVARESFDADPNWEGFRNRLLPADLPLVRQDFGYRRSQFAGGAAPGEIGGTVQRTSTRAWYAKEIAEKTLDDPLSVSGKFAVTRADASSGVMLGWFNENSRGWRTPNSLGIRIDGNGAKYWLFYEYGTRNVRTGGGGAFEGERYQTTKTEPFPADGTVHQWSLVYDPNGGEGEDGRLTFRIDDRSYQIPVAASHKRDGATFNRFGIWNVQIGGESMDVFFDDLVVDGERLQFDRDPGWTGEGNDVAFEERVIRPYHDFGFSRTRHAGGRAGEIGGIVFRDEQPAFYARPVGPLSLDRPLTASGRVALVGASSDSGVSFGWFDSESKRTKTTPEYEERQRNYLGITVEGPSRVGHYFRAAYSNSAGDGHAPLEDPRTGAERPVIRPDGRPHRWSLDYSPEAADGNGRITVRLDDTVHTLELRPGDRARGATFDRFGIFDMQSGGHHVEFYLDDLAYTAGAG